MKNSPNTVLIIVADSLKYSTVNNAELSRQSLQDLHFREFHQARSNSCWTLPSTASLFTGLIPHEHGATTMNRYLKKDIPTLSELFGKADYETLQITANSATTQIFGLDRGFKKTIKIWDEVKAQRNFFVNFLMLLSKPRYRNLVFGKDFITLKFLEEYKAGLAWFQQTCEKTFELALSEILERRKKKTFMFLNLMETHFPYHISDVFQLTGQKNRMRELKALYDLVNQSFLVSGEPPFDYNMSELLQKRQELSWSFLYPKLLEFIIRLLKLEEPLIIFCSDHGENFGHEKWYYHFSNTTEECLKIPFFLHDTKGICLNDDQDSFGLNHVYDYLVSRCIKQKKRVSFNSNREPVISESFNYNKKGKTVQKFQQNLFSFYSQEKKFTYSTRHGWYENHINHLVNKPCLNPILEYNEKHRNYLKSNFLSFRKFK